MIHSTVLCSQRNNHRSEHDIEAYKAFAERARVTKDEEKKKNAKLRNEVAKMSAELRELRTDMTNKVASQ